MFLLTAMAVLLPLLAALQYYWLGQVSEGATERLQSSLRSGATAFRHGAAQLGPAPPIELIALPSSSPLHTIGLAAKQPAWDALRKYLAYPPPASGRG